MVEGILTKEYYETGQLESEGMMIEGKEDGLWKYYHENGQLDFEGNFIEGKKTGLWKNYHENGILASEGVMNTGKKEGPWKHYNENGQLESEVTWKSGKKEELLKKYYYYENGQLESEGTSKEEKEGLWRYYHENGQLKAKGIYKEGKKEGSWKNYHENGYLEIEEIWEKNNKISQKIEQNPKVIKPKNTTELQSNILYFLKIPQKKLTIASLNINIGEIVKVSENILEKRGYRVRVLTNGMIGVFLTGSAFKAVHLLATLNPDIEIRRDYITGIVDIVKMK